LLLLGGIVTFASATLTLTATDVEAAELEDTGSGTGCIPLLLELAPCLLVTMEIDVDAHIFVTVPLPPLTELELWAVTVSILVLHVAQSRLPGIGTTGGRDESAPVIFTAGMILMVTSPHSTVQIHKYYTSTSTSVGFTRLVVRMSMSVSKKIKFDKRKTSD